MAGLLEGVKILEWAIWHAGPGGTAMLGDLGAEVIKIEQPKVGDPERGLVRLWGSNIQQVQMGTSSPAFETSNRNKRCITLDLSKDEAREIAYKLVKNCDVFMQNWRPGVAKEMKMDYDTLLKHNPKLIYCNVNANGPFGPDAPRRGQDYTGLARSGLLTAPATDDGEPPHISGAIADQLTSMCVAYGILGALLHRERAGEGQELDVSLLGSAICAQMFRLGTLFITKEEAKRTRKTVANPIYNHYKCKDGKWIVLQCLAQNIVWPDVCKALTIEELEKDPRFENDVKRQENNKELIKILEDIFAQKTRPEWLEVLKPYRRIMHSPLNDPFDLLTDPQAIENQYVISYEHPALGKPINAVGFPVHYRKTPAQVKNAAPEFGQHTEEILLELGYDWDAIVRLKDAEVT